MCVQAAESLFGFSGGRLPAFWSSQNLVGSDFQALTGGAREPYPKKVYGHVRKAPNSSPHAGPTRCSNSGAAGPQRGSSTTLLALVLQSTTATGCVP